MQARKQGDLTLARAFWVAAATVALTLYPLVAAASGTFDPHHRDYAGPQLITFVDSDAAPARCIGLAAETGDYLLMAAGFVAPITACSAYSSDRQRCTLIAPISAGVGQVVAALAALTGPNELLGHEFRHCRDQDFHPTLLPFAESVH